VAAPKAWAARETCLSVPLYTWKKQNCLGSKLRKYCHNGQEGKGDNNYLDDFGPLDLHF
jgi:hypothetical protein